MSKEQKGRLLIVDDTPTNLHLLMKILSEQGYAVYPATEGELALKFVQSTPPDLILLDIFLPGMDGYQVCQRLKADENTRDIPVIFICSADQELDKVKVFAIGGLDYIVEPFQTEEVLARIETHLSLRNLQKHLEERVEERTAQLSQANASLNEEISERMRAEALRAGQSRILEMIATSSPLEDILESLSSLIESQSEGMLCSVLLLDEEGQRLRHGAAPSLPQSYTKALDDTAIGPQVGSCGTAAFRGEPVFVSDIQQDPLWQDYRDLAAQYGLRACWSSPIISHQGLVLGTFAMYYREPRNPIPAEIKLIEIALHIAGIAIERQHAEQELRNSEARFRTLVEHAPEALVVLDLDTSLFVDANEKAVQLFGIPRKSLFKLGPVELSPPTQADGRPSTEAALEYLEKALHGETPAFEWTHRNALGEDIPCEIRLVRLPSVGRRLVRGSIIDISERLQADKALHASEKRFATAFQSSPMSLSINSLDDGRILAVNDYFLRTTGYTREELLGHTSLELNFWPSQAERDKAIELLRQHGSVHDVESTFVTKSGEVRNVLFSIEMIEMDGTLCTLLAASDITERKRTEEALQRSAQEISDLYNNAPCGYHALDQNGTFLRINDTELQWLGYQPDEVIGIMNISQLIPKEFSQDFQSNFARLKRHGSLRDIEFNLLRKDGSTLPVLLSSTVIKDPHGNFLMVNSTLFDITERKRLEEQFRQSQKMEAVGRLAGGIAHDFNNLLTAILGYSQLALLHLDPADLLHDQIQEIRKAAERAALLTSQLLAFSRRQILQPKVLDLNSVVEEMDNMLRRLIGEDIALVTALEPALAPVKADPGQLAQVIMNLAVNARDAMPQGGQLTILTQNVNLDQEYAASHLAVEAGAYVMLSVSDSGEGIAEEHLSHIFEPFFTTKEKGKGTGLGLSTIYGIIKQSGGAIWVSSELGKGACFKIYLPRVEEPAEVSQERDFALDGERGHETILLVEDEEIVRRLAINILKRSGYEVLEASGGMEALRQAEQYQGVIHLLLSDVVMPKMSGRELAERLVELRPQMKVLYMSGYTDDEFIHRGILELGTQFMQKPFTPDQLLQKVRDILDAEKPESQSLNES
jgi:two-component system, cell cycle sensor histidine kinase and response regulator CckA